MKSHGDEMTCHQSAETTQATARSLYARTGWQSVDLLATAVAEHDGIPLECAVAAIEEIKSEFAKKVA